MHFLLYPFMWIYTAIVRFRNFLFDIQVLKSHKFDLPVIVVGNLKVGGTGKTPHVDYIINLLKSEFHVASLSRGYGRKTSGFKEVNIENKSYETGDESLQIKFKYPHIPVFVGERRVEAISRIIIEHPEIQAIVLDDAYQHRSLKAGLNILLTEHDQLFINDKLLPLGRLREPISGVQRADCIIVTKCPNYFRDIDKAQIIKKLDLPKPIPVFFSSTKNGRLYPLLGHSKVPNPYMVEEVLLVCGIANPTHISNYLDDNYEAVSTLIFKDHHNFHRSDLLKIIHKYNSIVCKNKIIITTEKDAIRLKDLEMIPGWEKIPVYVLPIEVEIKGDDSSELNEFLLNYVRKNS